MREELFEEERKIIKDHDIKLLSELLYFNYVNRDKINIDYIYNGMKDNIIYSVKEEKEIKEDAIKIVKDKYNVDIKDKEI